MKPERSTSGQKIKVWLVIPLALIWRNSAKCSASGRLRARECSSLSMLLVMLLPIALAGDSVVAAGAAAASSGVAGFGEAFVASIGVILGTELGDKTFFIAAIMSMRHSPFIVWLGAVGALATMTVLGTIVGHVAPMLLSPTVTHYAAVCLFFVFGAPACGQSAALATISSDPPPPLGVPGGSGRLETPRVRGQATGCSATA